MDPLSALFVACWFAWLIIRDGGPIIPEARGQVPHTANNRHAERMQRMRHTHEKWMARHADRRSLRENPSLLRQAVDERLAGWVRNAGRRQDTVADRRRAAEERDVHAGRTAGTWRTAWRDARDYMSAWWRYMAERAEHRFSTRPTVMTNVVTDDDPQQPKPAPDQPPAAETEPKYVPSERLDEPKALEPAPELDEVDAEVVDAPETSASPEAEELPSNVIPLRKESTRMTAPTQTLFLSSGELTDPEYGRQWSREASDILGELATRADTAIGAAARKGLSAERVARLTNALQLLMAAQGEFDTAEQGFIQDLAAADLVRATGAGTHEGYLGNHN